MALDLGTRSCICVPALTLMQCVTVNMSLDFSGPQSLTCKLRKLDSIISLSLRH